MHSTNAVFTPRVQHILASTFVAISALYIFRWVFYPEMTFYVDDWNWLNRAVFGDWTAWTVFPSAIYNDRPIGATIITAFYYAFGLNYTPYGMMLVFIHITNGILISVVASKLLSSRFYGAIVGVLFVININVAYQAWWIGTIFDSTSLFFCLCAYLAFLSKNSYSLVLTALFYFIAVRSKEASLPFPFILFAYSFLEHNSSVKLSEIVKSLQHALRSTWPALLTFVVMFGIFMKYYIAAKVAAADFGPYAPKFDIPTMIDGAKIYLRYIVFNFLSLDNALLAYLAGSAIALLTWTRMAIFGSIGFLIAAAPVLVLATQRVPYYGYLPSPYVALLLVALVQRFDIFLASKLGVVSDYVLKTIVVATTIWFTTYIYAIGYYREPLLATMREASRAMKTLASALTHVENNAKVVITGVPPGPTLFMHAPCHAINVMFKVQTIDCRIEGTAADLLATYAKFPAPKILLDYNGGNVTLRERSP